MLEDAQFLLSFGLGENWAFEAAICDCLPARTPVCHAYDGSTSRQMPTGVGRDDLIARYEALSDGNRALHFKQNVSLKNDKKTVSLTSALSRIPGGVPVLLKMDIEGSEYVILNEIAKNPGVIHGLVFEIHYLDRLSNLAFAVLLRLMTQFDIVHVHANNCAGVAPNGLPFTIEVSMSRRVDPCLPRPVDTVHYPRKNLDAPNCAWMPDIKLRFAAMKKDKTADH